MLDEAAIDVMEALHSCRCCLRRASDKDLKTPYTHLRYTDIYLDMIKECFNIQLREGGEECGICSVCVGRLRDASAFKLQVERSQAELQAWLDRALQAIDEEPSVMWEVEEDNGTSEDWCCVLNEEPAVKLKVAGDDCASQASFGSWYQWRGGGHRDHTYAKTESPPAAVTRAGDVRPVSAYAMEQLAMACSVRLERLRGDEALHASQTCLATARRSPRRATSMIYICGICKKQFAYRSALFTHIRTHAGHKPFTCDVCSKTFAHSSAFRRHQQIHTGAKPYTCDTCQKQFSDKSHLTGHIRTHTGGRPYTCKVSCKTFTRRSTLRLHQLVHTGDKCDTCQKQFTDKRNLTTHIRTHTGDIPYICDVCIKMFADSSAFRQHQGIHTGGKRYTCHMCKKQFTQKINLNAHIRTHTGEKPYIWDVCSKMFADRSVLRRHQLIHTGDKRYTCNICDKRFTRKGNLTMHIRTHTGERPYTCDVCSNTFAHSTALRRHQQVHMGGNATPVKM